MIEIRLTVRFQEWLLTLNDGVARAMINSRLDRVAQGNPGNARNLKGGLWELKIDHGPGYRVYYTQRGPVLVIVLGGGDKRSQNRDIKTARKMIDDGEFE